MALLLATVLATVLASCGSAGGTPRPAEGGWTVREARGDWDDVDASLDVSLEHGNMAVLDRSAAGGETGARTITFTLVGARGEPGVISVTDLGPVSGREDAGRKIRLRAKFGRFGRPGDEARVLGAVAHRLSRLEGVDVRPLD